MYLTTTAITGCKTFPLLITWYVKKVNTHSRALIVHKQFQASIIQKKKLLGFFSGGWQDEKSIALVDIRCCHNLCGIPFNITPRNQETEIA